MTEHFLDEQDSVQFPSVTENCTVLVTVSYICCYGYFGDTNPSIFLPNLDLLPAELLGFYGAYPPLTLTLTPTS